MPRQTLIDNVPLPLVASPAATSRPGLDAMVRFAQESGNPIGTLPGGAWSTEFIVAQTNSNWEAAALSDLHDPER